jgi:midasin (ATPase involved in ribosome maturation)
MPPEPVLLTGETGVGKTTAIQHLAEMLRVQLRIVNLSQDSEFMDLVGGYAFLLIFVSKFYFLLVISQLRQQMFCVH